MKLSQLLVGVPVTKMFQTMFGRMVVTHDVEVRRIQYDSRKVERGDCFVAIRGTGIDGHTFAQQAMNMGAAVVVLEDDNVLPDSLCMHTGTIKIIVPDSRRALAVLSANYYGTPSKKMRVIGVTGTNGKTTSTHLIRSILEASGETVGLIGTIEYRFASEVVPATHTTPESLELNELMARMLTAGCTSISMEVSSHALHQSRVYGIDFQVAAFTNLTQDHLDYHKTMDEYFRAKKMLFDSLSAESWAITNRDDDWGRRLFASSRSRSLSYGFDAEADVRVVNAELSIQGSTITLEYRGDRTTFSSPLVGRFNIYNTLTAYTVGLALGVPVETMKRGIASLNVVQGRFERIASPAGWTAIIDYAHTPDALEKCLRTIHDVLPKQNRGRIITVFGAGGDRDKTKRPLMGAVVSELSDMTIITSDNPRTEDPDEIINDIFRGVSPKNQVLREVDRRRAVKQALSLARVGDVVLVAGKGHEDYQVIGKQKIHFSDREIVEEFLRSGK